jgi:hypothetical protein
LANSEELGRGKQTVPESSQSEEGLPGTYVIGFMLSRDPYLVANWPVQIYLEMLRKLFRSHLRQEKVRQPPGMSLVLGCHMTSILLPIGQFRRTLAWWENFFRRISDM